MSPRAHPEILRKSGFQCDPKPTSYDGYMLAPVSDGYAYLVAFWWRYLRTEARAFLTTLPRTTLATGLCKQVSHGSHTLLCIKRQQDINSDFMNKLMIISGRSPHRCKTGFQLLSGIFFLLPERT